MLGLCKPFAVVQSLSISCLTVTGLQPRTVRYMYRTQESAQSVNTSNTNHPDSHLPKFFTACRTLLSRLFYPLHKSLYLFGPLLHMR